MSPLLYAINYAVVGYFLATYIDNSIANSRPSVITAGWQAGAQFVATGIAAIAPSPAAADFTIQQLVIVGVFSALLAAFAGFSIGMVFQRTYRRAGTIGHDAKTTWTFGDVKARLSPTLE